jgi:hypothetical protein
VFDDAMQGSSLRGERKERSTGINSVRVVVITIVVVRIKSAIVWFLLRLSRMRNDAVNQNHLVRLFWSTIC